MAVYKYSIVCLFYGFEHMAVYKDPIVFLFY